MSRVVVAGAGPGGLAAAARLARLHHEVVVVERDRDVGGRWRPRPVDGVDVDTHAGVVTVPATLRDLFLKTGKQPLETYVELGPVDPVVVRHQFDDGTVLDLPNGDPHDVATAIADVLGDRAAAEWRRVVAEGARRWEQLRTAMLTQPVPAPRQRLADVCRRTVRQPHVRALLHAYALGAGFDPRTAPATVAALPYVEHAFRVWQAVGGHGALIRAIHQRALDRGATVLTDVAVTEITATAGRVDGVRLADGRVLPADLVVDDRGDGMTRYAEDTVRAELPSGTPPRLVLHGEPTRLISVTTTRAGPFQTVRTPAPSTPTSPHRRLWRRPAQPEGLFRVGRSPAFGGSLPFVLTSAAVVGEQVGRA